MPFQGTRELGVVQDLDKWLPQVTLRRRLAGLIASFGSLEGADRHASLHGRCLILTIFLQILGIAVIRHFVIYILLVNVRFRVLAAKVRLSKFELIFSNSYRFEIIIIFECI